MPKRRRGAVGPCGLMEATPQEAMDAALARACAAGAAPQESSEEELIDPDEVQEPLPQGNKAQRKKEKRRRKGAGDAAQEAAPDAGKAAKSIEAWADNEARVSRWLGSRGGTLEPQLEAVTGGVLRLQDFFPRDIADSALAIMEALPEDAWEVSEAKGEVSGMPGEDDAAKHRFWSTDLTDVPELLPLRSIFWQLLKTFRGEPTMPIFSCGRYGASDFIGRHDDRAHVPFFSDDNVFSRTVAAIWYLTRDWSDAEGGHLQDLQAAGAQPGDEPAATLVPIYNSLVAFEVPHMHAVTAVTAQRYRYSIYGWWHQKGKRYELPFPMPSAAERSAKPKDGKRKKVKKRAGKKARTEADAA